MGYIIKNPKTRSIAEWIILVILVAILAISLYYFVLNFESLRQGGLMRVRIRRQAAMQKIAPDQIRGWMTFRYLNLVFNMPQGYLQQSLNIKDSSYPNLSIDALAKQQKLSSTEVLTKTSSAIIVFISKSIHP
jgi:hypothetical protein